MSNEFLDYLEDIVDAVEKAEILLSGVTAGLHFVQPNLATC
jgi:hypothetical protein